MEGEALAIFLGMFVTAIVIVAFIVVFMKIAKSEKEKQNIEEYKQRSADSQQTDYTEEQRRQEELKKRLMQKYGLYSRNEPRPVERHYDEEQERKHHRHVEDAEEHSHFGEEEHYEEIIGSLGEVSDEGCADLNGVRFLVTDMAYEMQTQQGVDYNRIAQAIVLGEIVNSPRFKTPYSRHK